MHSTSETRKEKGKTKGGGGEKSIKGTGKGKLEKKREGSEKGRKY